MPAYSTLLQLQQNVFFFFDTIISSDLQMSFENAHFIQESLKVLVVFGLKFLGLVRAVLPCFADDLAKLKPRETVFSAESVYFKFVLELLDLLRGMLLVQKRNENFFAGIEEMMGNLDVFRIKSIRNVSAKFYKYSFGADSFESIGMVGPRIISKDDCGLDMIIYKEELVNFNDSGYDYLLDLQNLARGQDDALQKIRYNRRNFNLYFLEFFVSKNGLETLVGLVAGPSKFSQQVFNCIFSVVPEEESGKSFIHAKFMLKVMHLVFDLILALKRSFSPDKSIAFDRNFVNSPIDQNGPVLAANNRKVENIITENLADLTRIGFEFISSFDRAKSFKHDIFNSIELVWLVEVLWKEVRSSPKNEELALFIERDLVKSAVDESFFLESVIKFIKIFLENPNYSQKMDAATLLNSLEIYVISHVTKVPRQGPRSKNLPDAAERQHCAGPSDALLPRRTDFPTGALLPEIVPAHGPRVFLAFTPFST